MGSTFRGRFSRKSVTDGLMRPIAAMCAMNRIVTVTGCRIARNMGFASIGYVPEDGWYAGTEARYMGDIMADDENTAKAPSYTLVGLFTGYKYNYHNLTVDLFGRVDNLFDKEYVGSVIVNESNGRYYEPAPGRNYGVGMNIAWRFE